MESKAQNRIDRVFAKLAALQEKALITYIMAGDPDLAVCEDLVKSLAEGGADIVELGVPFSDPVADGPSIQRAGQRALAAGTALPEILGMVKRLHQEINTPIVLMSYYNPILKFGLEHFAEQLALSDVDGVIVPDLPLEESELLAELLNKQGVHLIPLLAPTSTPEKIELVAQRQNGFIYCVSLTGVTGVRRELPLKLNEFLQRVRSHTEQPIAVGFGIATPEQAVAASQHSDGVIVGSAIVNIVEKNQAEISTLKAEIRQFVGKLKAGLRN